MKCNQHDYFDVYYQPGNEPVFCYRSGMLVYEEKLYNGSLVTMGYNCAGFPMNILLGFPIRFSPADFREPFVFNIEINGQCIDYDLDFVDFSFEKETDHLHAILTLDSRIVPVRLHVHTILDGTQMFTRYITLENRSEAPVTVSRMCVFSGGIESMDMMHRTYELKPETYYSVGYFDNDQWGREGEFNWHDLMPGCMDVDFRFLRDRYRHPLIFLRNNIEGSIFFSQIAWSGGCRYSIDYKAVRESPDKNFTGPRVSMKAEITGHNPLLVLLPGEKFSTPEVHNGAIIGDLDAAVNEMHAHIRKSVLNVPETDPTECLIGSGMGAEHIMTVENTKSYIDQFAQMGAEIFIVDAGWQNRPGEEMKWHEYNGLNRPDPQRYPNGIGEIRDYCHSKGLKFCMWIEIERLGTQSDVFLQHPQWRVNNIFGQPWSPRLCTLDFTNPAAAAWAEKELSRMIEEYGLDMLRVDFNVSPEDFFNMCDINGTGMKECVALRHIQAVYGMYQRLKQKFPNVIFENCAGGGGRTDLGMMKAFHHTWVSDWQRMPHSAMITNGMTMALPPERVDRLCFGMSGHCYGSFDAMMRNAMLGHMSLNVIAPAGAHINPVQMRFVQHSVQLYKDFIRPILPTCKVYHHTPEVYKCREEGESILEIAAPDGTKGAITAFTYGGTNEKTISVMPRGIDTGLTYRITLDNNCESFIVSGHELRTDGLKLRIPASMSSELVLFEAIV